MTQAIHARGPALLGLIASAALGYAFYRLHVPLAWVLGPLVATAGFAFAGVRPIAPLAGRRMGQVVVGTAIGLNLTRDVLVTLAWWIPVAVTAAFVAMVIGALFSRVLARLGRIDPKTAYFAMMPGGLSEMSNIGARYGAQNEPIALMQALRIAVVVCILPPLIVTFGLEGTFETLDRAPDLLPAPLLAVLGAGLAGVGLGYVLRLNNPWMIGAIMGAAFLASSGLIEGRIPRLLFYAGQFLIGITIGARFRREVVLGLKHLALVGCGFIVAMMAALFWVGYVISVVGGSDLASAVLASSPGGFAEMAVTAEVLHLNVALVTLFHVIRAFIVNGMTIHVWTILHRLGIVKEKT